MSEQSPPAGPSKPSSARTAAIAGVTAGTLAVVGLGAFAAVHFLSGGPQAETAIPADAIAVVSMDLDPGAKQKVEALKTMRRFPGLRKQLKLGSGDDLREKFFDEALTGGHCSNLSYDADIKPWIGDNVALAAVSYSKGKASPVVALAVTDKEKASRGLQALFDCTDSGDDTAFAFNGDFVLISDSQAHANRAVRDARATPLTDDAAYQDWTGKVGDRGVANFYVARSAADFIADTMGSSDDPFGGDDTSSGSASAGPGDVPSDFPTDLMSGLPSDFPTDLMSGLPSDFPSSAIPIPGESVAGDAGASAPYAHPARNSPADSVRKGLAKFRGAAGALRFADGGAELEVVDGGVDRGLLSDKGAADVVTGLPGDTAAVLGIAIPEGAVTRFTDSLEQLGLPLFGTGSDFAAGLQSELGITVPDDLDTLLGQGVALSLSGTPVADVSSVQGPEDVPAGLTIKGDPDKIKAVIAKIEAKQGKTLADKGITVEAGNGKVSLSFDRDYAKSLQGGSRGGGDLGDNDTFKKVVPDADRAAAVGYVNFNSKWGRAIAKDVYGPDFLANTEPLEGLGLSSWVEGGTSHLLVKLTTD